MFVYRLVTMHSRKITHLWILLQTFVSRGQWCTRIFSFLDFFVNFDCIRKCLNQDSVFCGSGSSPTLYSSARHFALKYLSPRRCINEYSRIRWGKPCNGHAFHLEGIRNKLSRLTTEPRFRWFRIIRPDAEFTFLIRTSFWDYPQPGGQELSTMSSLCLILSKYFWILTNHNKLNAAFYPRRYHWFKIDFTLKFPSVTLNNVP